MPALQHLARTDREQAVRAAAAAAAELAEAGVVAAEAVAGRCERVAPTQASATELARLLAQENPRERRRAAVAESAIALAVTIQ